MKPRYFRLAAVLALSLIFSLPVAQAGAVRLPPGLDASAAGITGGALFGGTSPLLAEQGNLGRKLAIVRLYYMIGQNFKTPKVDRIMSAGGTVLASLDIPHGRGITYASVAAGHQDKQIRAWLSGVSTDCPNPGICQ